MLSYAERIQKQEEFIAQRLREESGEGGGGYFEDLAALIARATCSALEDEDLKFDDPPALVIDKFICHLLHEVATEYKAMNEESP